MKTLLKFENVNAFYGAAHILHGLSLHVEEGELLWYEAETPPAGAAAGVFQANGGPWMPVQPGAPAWLQARLQLIDMTGAA